MTVSAKAPVSRAGGPSANGSGAGPVAAPRVVNNRRLRTGGILLAVLLLVLGAALSALALLSATRTSAYLAIARAVPIGSQITAADLTTVELSGGQGLQAIPSSQLGSVVGRHAAVALVPGTLIVTAQLTDKTLVSAGDAQIGISVRSFLPLKAGDQIVLVPLSGTAGTASFNATVIGISARAADGTASLTIAVAALDAPTIITINANGGLGIYLKPQG